MAFDPKHAAALTQFAEELGVDPDLAIAVGMQESGSLGEAAVSPKGARGVMQVMPATSKELEPRYGTDLRRQGVGYLSEMHKRFKGPDQRKFALAAYNAGPGTVRNAQHLARKAGLDDSIYANIERFLPEETRKYIPGVLGRLRGGVSVANASGLEEVSTDPMAELAALAGIDPMDELRSLSEGESDDPMAQLRSLAGVDDNVPETRGIADSLYDRTIGRAARATDAALGGLPSAAAGAAGAYSAGDTAGVQKALTAGGGTGDRLRDVGLGLLELYLTGRMPGAAAATSAVGAGVEAATGSEQAGTVAEVGAGLVPAAKKLVGAGVRGARRLMGGPSVAEEVTTGLSARTTPAEAGRELQQPGRGARGAITQTADEASDLYEAAGRTARQAGAAVPPSDTSIAKAAKQALRDAKAAGRPITGPARRSLVNLVKLGLGPKSKIVGPTGKAAPRAPKAMAVDELIEAQSNLRREIGRLDFKDPGRRALIEVSKAVDDAMERATVGTSVGEELGKARGFYREVTIPTQKTMGRALRAEEPEAATRVLTKAKTPTRFQRLEGQQLGKRGAQFTGVVEKVRSASFNDIIASSTKGGKLSLTDLARNLEKAETAGQLEQLANTAARKNTIKAIRRAAGIQRVAGEAPSVGGGTGLLGGFGWFGLGAGYTIGRILKTAMNSERASRALLRLSQAKQGSPGWKAARKTMIEALKSGAPVGRTAVAEAREE
jgi:soluble lytic murein transglycosylase-like protein